MDLIRAIWETGNYWGRWAIGIFILIPISIIISSLLPHETAEIVVPIITILPLLAAVIFLIGFLDPMLLGAITAIKDTRKFLTGIAAITGAEMLMGIYFSLVPVSNDRGLMPVIGLIWIAIPLIYLGVKNAWGKKIGSLLILLMIILTAIFFLGGRNKSKEILSEPERTASTTSRAQEAITWVTDPDVIAAPDIDDWGSIPFYHLPSGKFRIAVKDGQNAQLLFSNGKSYLLGSDMKIDFGATSSRVKFRGVGQTTTIYVYRQQG
jgi:hypothetical protein